MKNPVLAGAIAGLVSAIVGALLLFVGAPIGLWGFGTLFPATLQTYAATTFIVLAVIFGPIVALIYSRFYDLIPGSGLRKGLNFGLIVWVVKDIQAAAYVTISMMQPIMIGVNLIVGGFYMWITYGLVIAYLYKR